MNPSSYSSIYTSTDAYSYASPVANFSPTISHLDHTSGFYEDPLSSAEGWSGEYVRPVEWSDADRALFEALVTVEVANASPSGSRTLTSSHSYNPELGFLYDQTETDFPHAQSRDGSHSCLSAAVMSTVSPPPEQDPHEAMALDGFLYPSQQDAFSPHAYRSAGEMSQPFYMLPFSHPSPFPEPFPQASSVDIAPQQRNGTAAPTSHLPIPLAAKQSRPEPAMASISPGRIYLSSVHCRHDLQDDRSTSVSPQSSRSGHRASPRHSSSFLPYPSPSPSPSPRPSSVVRASQRRNAPVPTSTAAPVAFNAWQCPYCPHIQHNRRSPDLRRHIKTHTRGAADVVDWVCCGVPVLDALELGVPAKTVREARVFDFDGTLMLGGCRKAFSRRDALMRHLQREKGRCFGDAQSLYQRGNRESLSYGLGGLW